MAKIFHKIFFSLCLVLVCHPEFTQAGKPANAGGAWQTFKNGAKGVGEVLGGGAGLVAKGGKYVANKIASGVTTVYHSAKYAVTGSRPKPSKEEQKDITNAWTQKTEDENVAAHGVTTYDLKNFGVAPVRDKDGGMFIDVRGNFVYPKAYEKMKAAGTLGTLSKVY